MSRYFSYIGEKASVVQRGVTFERNVPTLVTEAGHIAKLENNNHWQEVGEPEIKPVAVDPKVNDGSKPAATQVNTKKSHS